MVRSEAIISVESALRFSGRLSVMVQTWSAVAVRMSWAMSLVTVLERSHGGEQSDPVTRGQIWHAHPYPHPELRTVGAEEGVGRPLLGERAGDGRPPGPPQLLDAGELLLHRPVAGL